MYVYVCVYSVDIYVYIYMCVYAYIFLCVYVFVHGYA